VQTITGSLLNTPAASSSETVGTVQSDPGRAFSAVYAREMQQSGVSDSSETQDQSRPDDQSDADPLPLISVEEHPLDAALLADVWAILEEVAPLQEVAGPGGENLPDELTSQLVDTAFELGLLADELSSALVQKPIFDARSIDPAMFAAGLGTTPAGSGLAASHSGSTDVTQSLATRSLALSSLLAALPATTMAGGDVIGSVAGLPGSSLIGTTPGLPTSSQPISQAITDVLGRLRALLDAAGKSSPLDTGSTLSAQSTTASGAPLMFADLPVPLLAMSNIPSAANHSDRATCWACWPDQRAAVIGFLDRQFHRYRSDSGIGGSTVWESG
jgi:hypothetical protein